MANFPVTAKPLREIGLRDSEDDEIFAVARAEGAVVLTKDSDFVRLLEQHGSPPKILLLPAATRPSSRYNKSLGGIFPQRSTCSKAATIWSK